MITRIDNIKDFGIFKNFNWNTDPDIKDFNFKNLIYGWNYSGKTTLSRIFSSLRDKKLHESYTRGTFKIKTNDGDFDQSNLSSFPYDILVFNSDYIKDNLNFSIHCDLVSESNTILFEVGDNAKIEKDIIDLKNKIDIITGTETILGKKSTYKDDIIEFEIFDKSYSGKFTILAKQIKDDHLISLINFTKTNVKSYISNIITDVDRFIIKDKKKLATLSEIVKISEPRAVIENVSINLNYNEILEKANNILISTPERSALIKAIDNDSDAYIWVKQGRGLNTPNQRCIFCDNIISEERFNLLNNYFNNQASIIREQINQLKEIIRTEEINLKSMVVPASSNDFNLGFDKDYLAKKKELDKNLFEYKKHIKSISQKLDYKLSKSIYKPIKEIVLFDCKVIDIQISEINAIIGENNDFTIKFNDKISIERDKLINHLVALFLKREKYILKEKKYKIATTKIAEFDKKVQDLNKEIELKASKKYSDTEGALQYTYFIQSFLNRTDIEIKVDDSTKKFLLLRNNENASNLSEGEKTAIAFSHFLVTIKSLEKSAKFKEYIVFVDDPISSLDGNHIFQINSLLKEVFFDTIPSPQNSSQNMWNIKCKQLFLSSHNFEFFNLLKELPTSNGYRYSKKPSSNESRYFINRNLDESEILNLSSIYDDYKSEYHYLFNEIVNFNTDPNKGNSSKLLIMPNILRRFVEMYTMAKYPSNEEVDDRANKVFGKVKSKRILKPLHYFSHFNNIDRIGKQSDLIADLPFACSTLIDFVKEDKNHYEALMKVKI